MAEELRCALLCQHDAQVQDPDPLWRVIASEWPVHGGKLEYICPPFCRTRRYQLKYSSEITGMLVRRDLHRFLFQPLLQSRAVTHIWSA